METEYFRAVKWDVLRENGTHPAPYARPPLPRPEHLTAHSMPASDGYVHHKGNPRTVSSCRSGTISNSAFGSDTGIPSPEMQKTEEKPLKPTVCNHFPQCAAV